MAACLSSDGKLWAFCRWCRNAIWRYPNGKLWRTSDKESQCVPSRVGRHFPEG